MLTLATFTDLESLYGEVIEAQIEHEAVTDNDRVVDSSLDDGHDLEAITQTVEGIMTLIRVAIKSIGKIFSKLHEWYRKLTKANQKILRAISEATRDLKSKGRGPDRISAGAWINELTDAKEQFSGDVLINGLTRLNATDFKEILTLAETESQKFYKEITESAGDKKNLQIGAFLDLLSGFAGKITIKIGAFKPGFNLKDGGALLGGWTLNATHNNIPGGKKDHTVAQLLTGIFSFINPMEFKVIKNKNNLLNKPKDIVESCTESQAQTIEKMAEEYFDRLDDTEELLAGLRKEREKFLNDLKSKLESKGANGLAISYQKMLINQASKWNEGAYIKYFRLGIRQYTASAKYIAASVSGGSDAIEGTLM